MMQTVTPKRTNIDPIPLAEGEGAQRYRFRVREERPRRELNRRALAISLLLVTLSAVGIAVWHHLQMQRLADALVAHGDTLLAQGNYEDASAAFHRAWKIQRDPALLAKLAPAYDQHAYRIDPRGVMACYQRALGRTDDPALRVRLAEILLRQGMPKEAQEQAEKVLATVPSQRSAMKWRALAALASHRRGDRVGVDEVRAWLHSARAVWPHDLELAVELVDFLRQDRELGGDHAREADQVMDGLVAARPASAKHVMARYHYRMRFGLPGAADDLELAVRLAPRDAVVLLAAARDAFRVALRTRAEGDFLVARELFRQCTEVAPERAEGYLGLGDVLLSRGSRDAKRAAIAIWQQGEQLACGQGVPNVAGDAVAFAIRIAEAQIQLGSLAAAQRSLKQLEGLQTDLDSRHPTERAWAEVAGHALRGQLALAEQAWERALPHLRRAAAASTTTDTQRATAEKAQRALANTLELLARPEEAVLLWEQWLHDQPGNSEARLAAARLWSDLGDHQRALHYLEQLGAASRAETRTLQAQILWRLARSCAPRKPDAIALRQSALLENPHCFELAWLAFEQATTPQAALAQLVLIQQDHPMHPQALRRMPRALARLGLMPESQAALERLQRFGGPTAQTQFALAKYYLEIGDHPAAEQARQRVERHQLSASQKLQFDRHQLEHFHGTTAAAAPHAWMRLAAQHPHVSWPLVGLLDLCLADPQVRARAPWRQAIVTLRDRGWRVLADCFEAQVMLLEAADEREPTGQQVGLLRAQLPGWHRTWDLVARWHAARGEDELAADARVAAAAARPSSEDMLPQFPAAETAQCAHLVGLLHWTDAAREAALPLLAARVTTQLASVAEEDLYVRCLAAEGNKQQAIIALRKQLNTLATADRRLHLVDLLLEIGAGASAMQVLEGLTHDLGAGAQTTLRHARYLIAAGAETAVGPLIESFASVTLAQCSPTQSPAKLLEVAQLYRALGDDDKAAETFEIWLDEFEHSAAELGDARLAPFFQMRKTRAGGQDES